MIITIRGFPDGEVWIHIRIAFDVILSPSIIHVRDLFVEADLLLRIVFNASRNRLVVIELDFGRVYDQVVNLA